jgi:hypothetical protein
VQEAARDHVLRDPAEKLLSKCQQNPEVRHSEPGEEFLRGLDSNKGGIHHSARNVEAFFPQFEE